MKIGFTIYYFIFTFNLYAIKIIGKLFPKLIIFKIIYQCNNNIIVIILFIGTLYFIIIVLKYVYGNVLGLKAQLI